MVNKPIVRRILEWIKSSIFVSRSDCWEKGDLVIFPWQKIFDSTSNFSSSILSLRFDNVFHVEMAQSSYKSFSSYFLHNLYWKLDKFFFKLI